MSERMPTQPSGAADFLGLSEELPQAESTQAPSNAWLFEMEAEPPIASVMSELAPLAQAPHAMLAQAPSAEVLTPETRRGSLVRPSKVSSLLMGLAGLILLGGAVLLLPWNTAKHFSGPSSNVPEQASVTQRARPARSNSDPALPQATNPASSDVAASSPTSTPQGTAAEVPAQSTPALSEPSPSEEAVAALPSVSAEPESVNVLVLPEAVPAPSARSSEPLVQLGPGVRRATASDYSSLYMGTELPTQEIQGSRRLSTPQVGHVRVELLSGESYQGKLHSVGMGCVWIDLELGRMRMEARELRQIDKLPTLSKASALEQAIVGLPQVRVRTPGGSIDGWLVSRTDDKVTLVTASAQRLVLESREVEPLASPQVRIVGRKQP
jgi:hypothetical protein